MICSRQSYLFLSFVYLLSARSSPYQLVRKVWFSDLSHLTLYWVYWNVFSQYVCNSRTGLRVTYLCWLSAVLYVDFFWRVRKLTKKRLLASSCLSVRTFLCMEELGSHWTDFYEIWYLRIISKIRRESSSFIKIGQVWRVLYMKTTIIFFYHISLSYS